MKIKCIGGPNDDEWVETDRKLYLYDCVNVSEKQSVSVFDFNPNKLPKLIISYSVYIIDCFHFSRDDVYYFLRPSDWTNKQAMLHQFSKRCLNSSHGETGKRN